MSDLNEATTMSNTIQNMAPPPRQSSAAQASELQSSSLQQEDQQQQRPKTTIQNKRVRLNVQSNAPQKQSTRPPALENLQQQPLAHFSYHCPGLHDKGSHTLVERRALVELLEGPTIIIPLFQRAYCWKEDVVAGWWASSSKGSAHSIGKAIYTEHQGDLWCLDGQQRITTTCLLLSAARDVLSSLLLSTQTQSNSTQAQLLSSEKQEQEQSRLVDEKFCLHGIASLEALLFNDVDAAREWRLSNTSVGVGQRLEFVQVVPSHIDRQPFFELVCGLQPSERTLTTNQFDTKRWFEAAFIKLAAQEQTVADKVRAIIERATLATEMQHMIIQPTTAINVAQVYQWVQEKTLLSAGAVLFNPTPGKAMKAADLTRNLLLAPFLLLTLSEQEAVFENHWLAKVELPCDGVPDKIDQALEILIRQVAPTACDAEKRMAAVISMPFLATKDLSGLTRYTRMLSVYEQFVTQQLPTIATTTAINVDEDDQDQAAKRNALEQQVAIELMDRIGEINRKLYNQN